MHGLVTPGSISVALEFQEPKLNKMLELTEEQTAELQKITSEATKMIRQLPPGSPPQFLAAMLKHVETILTETQAKVDEVLKPEQRTKFREILFQLAGGLNLPPLNEHVFECLKLTDVQKWQIRELATERVPARRAAEYVILDTHNRTPLPREELSNRLEAARQQIEAKYIEQLKSFLTAEQRAQAEKLTAEIPALHERLGLPLGLPPHQIHQWYNRVQQLVAP